MLSRGSFSVRHWWLASVGMLLLAGCGRYEPPALQGAATEPAAAVRQLADYLHKGDLVGFSRAAVPPSTHQALGQAWAEGHSLWPLTGLPLDEHLPGLLEVLAAEDAEAELQRVFKAQFEGQATNLRQTAHSLGMFGAQYVSHQGDYSELQREHYRQLVLGLSRWAGQAPLSDPALAQATIAGLTQAAHSSGLDGAAALQAAGMEPALERLSGLQLAMFEMFARYGLDLRRSLAGLQVGLLQEQGDQALVQVQYTLGEQAVSFKAQMRRIDGRWYMQQNLDDAQRILDAAAQTRQLQAPPAAAQGSDDAGTEPAQTDVQDAQMASGP